EIKFLVQVRLHEIRIDTSRRGEDDLLYLGLNGFGENQPVQEEIRCRAGLVQIHIAASAVIRRQMKDRVHALHGRACDSRLAQVRLDEFHLVGAQVLLKISQVSAGKIVDDADFSRSSREELVRQGRTDERRAP